MWSLSGGHRIKGWLPQTSLSEPNGLLSKKVPSKAIELANTQVAKLNVVEALI